MSTEEPTPRPRPSFRRLLKDVAVSVAVALLVVLAMTWLQRQSQRGGGGTLPVGEPAPAFRLEELETGETLSLEDLRGRPVVLNFWATWCNPCMRELPGLERLHRESEGRFHVVTVNGQPPAVVLRALRRRDLALPVLHDPAGRVQAAYHVERIPMTVLLDAEGRVVHDFTGEADMDILRDHMERLLGEG
ncbi:MAG: TlpA family protein disulfide reductase [Myxococcota bacterium]